MLNGKKMSICYKTNLFTSLKNNVTIQKSDVHA